MPTLDNKRFSIVFVRASCLILFATGLAKIFSTFGHARILGLSDPLLHLPYRYLFLTSGSLELLVVVACLFRVGNFIAVCLIGCLALTIGIYRLAFHFLGPDHSCPCLGTFTSYLKISPQIADWLLTSSLAFMLFGSFVVFISYSLNARRSGHDFSVLALISFRKQ